jgi:hypothetical protein
VAEPPRPADESAGTGGSRHRSLEQARSLRTQQRAWAVPSRGISFLLASQLY